MTVTEDRLARALQAQTEAVHADPAAAGRLHAALRLRRRHTWLATALAAVAIATAVAVGVTVPGHVSHATVVPAKPSGPYPTFQQGGKAIAGGQITSPAQGTLTFTFVPTSYELYLASFCSNPHTLVATAVNGHLVSFGGCGGGVGNVADPAASLGAWKTSSAVVLGARNTVTVTLVDGVKPTAQPLPASARPTGTVSAAIYQGVPVADYPLPPKPPHLPALTSNGGEPVVLDSRTVGANGTFTIPLTVGSRLDLTAVAPGQLDVWANGVHLETDAFWNYRGQTALIDLSAARLRGPHTIPASGVTVTVTITASRFTGPYWLASTSAGASSEGCAGSLIHVQPVPAGQEAQHTAAEAEAVWRNAHVGPESRTSTTLIWAVDPVAVKLGLPSPDQPRLLWQIIGTSIYEPPSHAGPVPNPTLTPGAVLHMSTLVDDATLQLAGNFSCN